MRLDVALLLPLHYYIAITTAFVVFPKHGCRKISQNLFAFPSNDASFEGDRRRRQAEFGELEPLRESKARRERLDREKQNEYQFAKYGNDLWDLRTKIHNLSVQLVESINAEEAVTEMDIRRKLRKAELRDPEHVYKMELEAMQHAAREGRTVDVINHKTRALNARSRLPQFNLEGLWVGK